MSEAGSVLHHSAVYAAGAILNRGVGFFLIPVLTWFLPAREYGIFAIITIAAEIFGAIIGMQLGTAMSRIYFDYSEEDERAEVVTTAVLGFSGLALTAALALIFTAEPLARVILVGKGLGGLLFIGVIALFFNIVFSLGIQYLTLRQRSRAVLFVSTTRSILYLGATLVLVAWLRLGVTGALLALLITNAISAGGLGAVIVARLRPRFSRSKLLALLRFGTPLVPGQLAELSGKFIDRFLLANLASVSSAGIYFLGLRFSAVLHMVLQAPFNQIFIVRRLEAYERGGKDPEAPRVFTYFFLLIVSSGLALSLIAPELVGLVSIRRPEYLAAAAAIPLLALAQIVQSVVQMEELGIVFAKLPRYITYVSLMGLAAHVLFNLALIPRLAVVGAALALCLSTLCRFAATWWFARGLGGPRPQWLPMLVILMVAAIAFALGRASELVLPAPASLSIRLALALAAPMTMFWSPLFSAGERSEIRDLLGQGLRRFRRAAVSPGHHLGELRRLLSRGNGTKTAERE